MTRLLLALVLTMSGASPLLQTTTHAATWTADPAASTLGFSGKYEGDPFEGKFRKFTPTIAFDGKDPASLKIAVDIDMASVDSGNEDRDGTLRTPEFFWWEKYPKARFETTSCRAGASATQFVCAANLTIREKTKTLDFPLSWTANADGSATLAASVTLNRLDYDVGTGEWADDPLLSHAIGVTTKLKLKKAP